jgi:mRNA interferase MazF
MKSPQHGEVWLVDLGLAGKVRPCLVLSVPPDDEDRALVTIIPNTTAIRGSRFEVDIPLRFLRGKGVFNAQDLITVPLSKCLRHLGSLDSSDLESVKAVVRSWLSM